MSFLSSDVHHCLVPESFHWSAWFLLPLPLGLLLSFLCNGISHLLLSSFHHISLTPIHIRPSHSYVPIKIGSQLHYNNSLLPFAYSNIPPLDYGPLDDDNSALSPGLNTLLLWILTSCLPDLIWERGLRVSLFIHWNTVYVLRIFYPSILVVL